MEVLVFIIVIVALILVHEFGHFIVAKLSGMRVDEFGLGYPPRAAVLGKIGETSYTLNWLPFGGFVKIYGEDGGATGSRAFSARPRILQALTLVAGVAMNFLFAYVLIAGALFVGTPRALSADEISRAHNLELAVAQVLPGSPAARVGLLPGDTIVNATDAKGAWKASDPQSFSEFIAASDGQAVELVVLRNSTTLSLPVVPKQGIASNDPSRYAIGAEVATIGVAALPLASALSQGAIITWGAFMLTANGLWHLLLGIFTLHPDLSQVAGPVGIAGAIGSASTQGFGDLLSLVAIISINLALINLIPVPALDGGRLLFVIIEGIIRRPIKPSVARAVNSVGFALLILLMVVVTLHDVFSIIR